MKVVTLCREKQQGENLYQFKVFEAALASEISTENLEKSALLVMSHSVLEKMVISSLNFPCRKDEISFSRIQGFKDNVTPL